MRSDRGGVLSARLVLGVGLMLLGTLFMLDELRIFDVDDVLRWWPLLPLAVGLTMMARPGGTGSRAFGVLLAIFGVWQLAYDFDFIDIEFWDAWPLLLIGLGGWVVWRSLGTGDESFPGPIAPAEPVDLSRPPAVGTVPPAEGPNQSAAAADPTVSDADSLSAFALLGYAHKVSTSQSFEAADATAIMGGCTLDLRAADIGPEGAVIDAFSFWGGIRILVPEDWVITNKVLPLLGGLDDKTRPAPGSGKQVLVRGTAVMGGVEIANHDEED